MASKQNVQEKVLHFLTEEFLTVKQIATRRKTSKRAVYYVIKKLKKKGLLKGGFTRGLQNPIHPSTGGLKNLIRLHGQEFNIKILFKDYKYKELLAKSNIMTIGGNKIRLYNDSIEIYGNNAIFYGKDEKDATTQSMAYWFKFFNRLENELNILIVKDRSKNIKQVNAHYSEIDNEIAKEANKTKEKIDVKAKEDGKTWAKIDNSFNLHELETLHPETAKQDIGEVIRPFLNDLRDNKPPVISKIMLAISTSIAVNKNTIDILKETAAGLNSVVQILKPRKETNKKITPARRPDYIG